MPVMVVIMVACFDRLILKPFDILRRDNGKARFCSSWPCNSGSLSCVLLRCSRRDCLYLLAGLELRVQLDAGPGDLRYCGAAEVDL